MGPILLSYVPWASSFLGFWALQYGSHIGDIEAGLDDGVEVGLKLWHFLGKEAHL